MVSSSPFEEGQAAEGGEQLINEEPTQIFFSADDMDVVKESEPPRIAGGVPIDGPPPLGGGVVQATFRPGSSPPVAQARTSMPGGPPPISPPSAALGFAPPPEPAAQPAMGSLPPERTPVMPAGERNLPTMEMAPVDGEAAKRELDARAAHRGGSRRTVLWAGLGAAAMLALGIVGALAVFGGDDVGTIEIRTTPSIGAAVIIDGTSRGSAPLRIERIPAGERVIEIRADGFDVARRTITVTPGTTAMLEIALQPVAPAVASAPASAAAPTEQEEGGGEPEAGGAAGPPGGAKDEPEDERPAVVARAETPPARETRQARTEPTKVASTSTPRERPRRETRTEGSTRTPRATERPRAGNGTLVINAIPWARVFIDGRDTGRNTPVPSLRVRAGTRTVGLRTADGQMHNFSVDVETGETIRLMKRL